MRVCVGVCVCMCVRVVILMNELRSVCLHKLVAEQSFLLLPFLWYVLLIAIIIVYFIIWAFTIHV